VHIKYKARLVFQSGCFAIFYIQFCNKSPVRIRIVGERGMDIFMFLSLQEGGEMVEPSSSKIETIQHQYDTLIKKNLKGEARSYLRSLSKISEQEVCFSDMVENDFNRLYSEDTYDFEYYIFHVSGFDITVKDILLGEALEFLNKQNRDIVLLFYYLDMSDAEISELLNVVRSTVFRHRKAALSKIKEYMEGKGF